MANGGVQNRNAAFEICLTPQPDDLTEVQFSALTYVDVCCLSELPEFASEAEMISANCIDGTKLVGVGADSDTDFTLSVFYMEDCEGQDELRDMALAKDGVAYAVRKVYSDGVATVSTPTTVYARVVWTGFNDGGGGIDDFVTHTFTGAIRQGPVFVKTAAISGP